MLTVWLSPELLADLGIRNPDGTNQAFTGHRVRQRQSEAVSQSREEKRRHGADAKRSQAP